MSFVERSIALCPYLGESTISGSLYVYCNLQYVRSIGRTLQSVLCVVDGKIPMGGCSPSILQIQLLPQPRTVDVYAQTYLIHTALVFS